MRVGVGGGNRLLRGGVSVGRGGIRGGVGAGPFSLSGGGRPSGAIATLLVLCWRIIVFCVWAVFALAAATWRYVLRPLAVDVFMPRWRGASSTSERFLLALVAAIPVAVILTVGVIGARHGSDGQRPEVAQSPGPLVTTSGAELTGGCTIGMNLEDCEDLHGLSAGQRVKTIDCSGSDRDVLWAANWWIIAARDGVPVISKSESGCR